MLTIKPNGQRVERRDPDRLAYKWELVGAAWDPAGFMSEGAELCLG
jgi:hypothetical protein